MNFVFAFLFAGVMCSIAQIILDNTKLTPGHITSIYTAVGAFLGFLGLYDKIIEKCGAGASLLIMNFGNALYKGALEGYYDNAFLGIFQNMLSNSSAVITFAIVCAFVVSLIFKPKN